MATDGTDSRALTALGRGAASGLATALVLLALAGLFGWPVASGSPPSRPAVVAAVAGGLAVAALVVALTVAERVVR